MSKPLLVFDMDGVLVDVKESYRETIRATVNHFCGKVPSHEEIQHYKNLGGYNNDWLLSQRLCQDYGRDIAYQEVVDTFNRYFFGNSDTPGLMEKERWLPLPGLLERLADRFALAIFTGRLRDEAQITLRRFAADIPWLAVVGDDDVARSKPDPDGLMQLRARGEIVFYLGDSVDDAKAGRDAGVPFVAITAPGGNFSGLPVAHYLDNINELESIL